MKFFFDISFYIVSVYAADQKLINKNNDKHGESISQGGHGNTSPLNKHAGRSNIIMDKKKNV